MEQGVENKYRFSVVICTYNRSDDLKLLLSDMAGQKFSPSQFEVVVVDNNSTDGTNEVMEEYIQTERGIHTTYLKEENQGVSFARNAGVKAAKGEYIVFIDDDERVEYDFLIELDDFFRAYPQAQLCAERVDAIYPGPLPRWFSPYIEAMLSGEYYKGERVKKLKTKDYPGTGHATFKRSLFYRFGGFNTDLGRRGDALLGGEDKDFFLRLIRGGIDCYYVPKAVIYHHIKAYRMTDEFFNKITYAIGRSERLRTLNISRAAYYKRLLAEVVKWGGTLALSAYYIVFYNYSKGQKLIQFRRNVTRGLTEKN